MPGMIELPGCICGRLISLNPQRGPDASKRRSLQIFVSFDDVRFSTPDSSTYAPVSDVARALEQMAKAVRG